MIALANEHAGPAQSDLAKCDVVRIARGRVIEDPARCKLFPDSHAPGALGFAKGAEKTHQHGSVMSVSAYLGGVNWDERTVGELIQLEDAFEK